MLVRSAENRARFPQIAALFVLAIPCCTLLVFLIVTLFVCCRHYLVDRHLRRCIHARMNRREHGSGKPVSSDELLRQEAAVYLSPAVEHQLAHIMARRESIESALQRMDVEIYNLESEFLKHCVSFGGSLFDGFGVERRTGAHRNPVAVLTPLHSSSPTTDGASASGGFEANTLTGALPRSPLLTTTAAGEQLRTYQFLTSSLQHGGSGGEADGNAGTASAAVFQVGSKGASSPAFHYRIHFFSPSERVFSACSVGALSRVEIAKSTGGTGSGAGKVTTRPMAAASSLSAVRGQGKGKRGRRGGGGVATTAFAREPDAPPSRRRPRGFSDGDDEVEDEDSNSGPRRRRRRTE